MPATPARTGDAAGRKHALWRTRLAVRRGRVQWQLLAVVTGIAVLASTLISSLTLLVSVTELGAVRGALSEAASQSAEIRVILTQPEQPIELPRARAEKALTEVLGDAATGTSTTMALSRLYWVMGEDTVNRLFYVGELEGLADEAALVEGSWPSAGSTDEIALPAVGAAVMGLGVGDTFSTQESRNIPAVKATVTGLYSVEEPSIAYWKADRLKGEGFDPAYPIPGTAGTSRANAIGPGVMAAGALEATGTAVDRYIVRMTPNFSNVTVEALDGLALRLSTAVTDTTPVIGDVAKSVDYASTLDPAIRSVTSAMAVTRSTVAAVSLLLLVLSLAALAQAARLLTEARVGERHLMRARGASSSQILGLAVVEAALIAGIAAVLSPVIARLAYLAVATQPAMVESGMPVEPGFPPIVWAVAIGTAALFGFVLVAPLLRREGSFHEGEQGNARQQRFSGLQRSGLDVALIVLAGVAYWQLLSYEGAGVPSTFGVDPVLVAGPVLILLAGSLIAVRLVPTVAKLTERIAARSRGAVVSLAAWEVGRRAQRATAAILLLTLALAVGTFSLSFLATWKQSQLDQAAFALGAPIRITAEAGDVSTPRDAEPVLRLDAIIAGADVPSFVDPSGEPATVVGLTQDARFMLAQGRLADSGGSAVSDSLSEPRALEQVIVLPERTAGLSATVKVTPDRALPTARVQLKMLVQDLAGVQWLVDMGFVPVDGKEHEVRGLIPDGKGHNDLAVVGYQVQASVMDPVRYGLNDPTMTRVLVKGLGALGIAVSTTPIEEIESRPVTVADMNAWRVSGNGEETTMFPRPYVEEGWQFGLNVTVPRNLGSEVASYAHTSWPIVTELPAVITRTIADAMRAEAGDRLTIVANGVAIPMYIMKVVDAAPGVASLSEFGPLAGGNTGDERAVVVDQDTLARALFQQGEPTLASEWWADVPESETEAFLDALSVSRPTLLTQNAHDLGLQMQQHPVRVATQAALWLVIAGAVGLATAGFAVHATGSLRSRATEFAQLRAVGLTRRRLVGIIGIESLLLCVLGAAFGIGLGVLLALLVAPLVGVSADGSSPTPSVEVHVPVPEILLMVALLGVVLAAVVMVAARVQRVAEPATALRQGEER